jgi:uracil-DNA glycosylase
MSMNLDARQRAMLAEMGVQVWLPEPVPAPPEGSSSGPETTANNAPSTPGKDGKRPEQAPRDRQSGSGEAAVPRPPMAPASARAPQPCGIEAMDWTALRDAVTGCQACGLCQGRTQTVFGVGDTAADWMVVGEAPGEQEDLQGEPFVGPSGQLLDNMLKAIGLSRHAGAGGEGANGGSATRGVYIANVAEVPSASQPQPANRRRWCGATPYLAAPDRAAAVLKSFWPWAVLRFSHCCKQPSQSANCAAARTEYHGVPVIATYHPAYLLRNLPDKAKAWADLCLADGRGRTRRLTGGCALRAPRTAGV